MTKTKNWNVGWRRYALSAPTLDVDIVEDHPVMREGLAVWLEGNTQGIRVVGRFASWDELVPHLDRLSDVVILDVLLGDNIPLSAKIRVLLSAGPQVMVCSCVTDPAVIRQAYAAGALAYVPKTAPATVVAAGLRAVAQGDKYVPPEVAAALASEEPTAQLTAKEHEVVSIYLGGSGATMAETAEAMGISADGVKKHLASVRRKFQNGQEPVTRLALRQRLVDGGWLQD